MRLAAEKIFIEIAPERDSKYYKGHPNRGLWWKRPSTREPLEQSIDKILAEEFSAKTKYLRELLGPFVENCVYCNGSGRIEMGVNDSVTSADCSWCSPFRETLKLLPPEFPQ
jgi:hypothetical protein